MTNKRILIGAYMALFLISKAAFGFCGFYVSKADAKLYNQASQVVLVRHGDKTVLTMANDYQGDPKEFAVVVPVPTVLEREQINVGDPRLIEHLDAYSAPRLVEYFDPDPCGGRMLEMAKSAIAGRGGAQRMADRRSADSLGVKIEARYEVGEYDILILSAEQSKGLETWLRKNNYRIPAGASEVLGSYIKTGMKFFVAKVNLERKQSSGFSYLRPLQIAYESRKFMLPIRLGMVNAKGPQDLLIYALTPSGRVETTNYRTTKIPSDVEVPLYVKDEFKNFYRDMFSTQVRKQDMRTVLLEYAWDMGWCDPCAADPLSREELRKLGVFWLDENSPPPGARMGRPFVGGPLNVYVTRLHLRYDRDHFPEDLAFQETGDRQNFQGRYILRHAWNGAASCEAGKQYLKEVAERERSQAETLASLTGWSHDAIQKRIGLGASKATVGRKKWYETLWK